MSVVLALVFTRQEKEVLEQNRGRIGLLIYPGCTCTRSPSACRHLISIWPCFQNSVSRLPKAISDYPTTCRLSRLAAGWLAHDGRRRQGSLLLIQIPLPPDEPATRARSRARDSAVPSCNRSAECSRVVLGSNFVDSGSPRGVALGHSAFSPHLRPHMPPAA